MIYITGHNGFVGNNLIKSLIHYKNLIFYVKNKPFNITRGINTVIHLAGKAHDINKKSNYNDYYKVNTELTINIFDCFLNSEAKVFITLSSVKAVADNLQSVLTEDYIPNPITDYGVSKLLAEKYILSKEIPKNKRVYILRPCMIHGEGNKGNMNLLYKIVTKGIPWPLGAYNNKRSFCSIDNLCFVINELIVNDKIKSGIYNISDDESISTNELISIIANSQSKIPIIWKFPKFFINYLAKLGDILHLPLNTERLSKLTETYEVSNNKIKDAIKKEFPITSREGLLKTFKSFKYLQ